MSSAIIPASSPNFNTLSGNAAAYRNTDARHSCASCEYICADGRGSSCPMMAETLRESGFPVSAEYSVYINDVWTGICECYECDEEAFRKAFDEYPGEYLSEDEINGIIAGIDCPGSLVRR